MRRGRDVIGGEDEERECIVIGGEKEERERCDWRRKSDEIGEMTLVERGSGVIGGEESIMSGP